mmetsp:Transcript_39027/g.123880  ORF Transcript_39027/g.123880 Transcript_39027/m.123880 type:complete len:95 (+) Transcript_39027:976-1260(+)
MQNMRPGYTPGDIVQAGGGWLYQNVVPPPQTTSHTRQHTRWNVSLQALRQHPWICLRPADVSSICTQMRFLFVKPSFRLQIWISFACTAKVFGI